MGYQNLKDKYLMLLFRFSQLESLLEPIHDDIGLTVWWSDVRAVFGKLLNTFDGNPDKGWWKGILDEKRGVGYGAKPTYDGWFVSDILGIKGKSISTREFIRGFTMAPLTITNGVNKEEAMFLGGIAGFKVHVNPENNQETSVEPVHGWTLMMKQDSLFRKHP